MQKIFKHESISTKIIVNTIKSTLLIEKRKYDSFCPFGRVALLFFMVKGRIFHIALIIFELNFLRSYVIYFADKSERPLKFLWSFLLTMFIFYITCFVRLFCFCSFDISIKCICYSWMLPSLFIFFFNFICSFVYNQ